MAGHPDTKLTADQAADRIGISSAHLAKLRMRGEGPSFFKLSRKVLYDASDVDAWLAARRVVSVDDRRAKAQQRSPHDQHAA